MHSLPPDEVLPVLVADLADDESKDVLESAAVSGGRVYVPLETAPVNTTPHVLEVYIPSVEQALRFIAEPLGPPSAHGFPLRIKPMPDAKISRKNDQKPSLAPLRRRRSTANFNLSASHTADLSVVGPLPKAPDDQLVGRSIAGGKLTIEQLIGRGGVGAVYKARHRALRMPVAVKVLHESFQKDIDFCRRFYAEALAASRLDHPNITRVIDFGQEPDGLLYLAMEFLNGVELRAILDKEKALGPERIAELMMQVCAGLSHAHARGIVHRDIKPENLVLVPGHDDDGKEIEIVKVCDFGIAQHRSLENADQDGAAAGTPEYMSPEQCRADELDARSDLYACGVILYELATGQVPFTAERPQSILNKHQFTPPVPPSKIRPDIDPLLEKITLKALEKEADDRQQNMRQLRVELRELLGPILMDVSPSPMAVQAVPAVDAVPEEAPASRAVMPEWLERGAAAYSNTAPTTVGAYSTAAASSGMATNNDVAAIATNTTAWIQELAKQRDPRAFAKLAQRLEPQIRALAGRGEAKTLWAVSSALHGIAMEGTQAAGSRAHVAAEILRIFDDPAILATVAEQLLVGPEDSRDYARRILVNAGVAGAYGLYGARVKLANEEATRKTFTATLKDFGPKAWPVVRAALEKIIANPSVRAMELAEDLLLCAPAVGDESAGHLVVKYLRVNSAGVCRAATAAIVNLWGDRAQPLLVGMLQSKDDVVRIAGIAGLRQLNGIDEHVVPRLHAILMRRVPAGDDVRAAAAMGLGHASNSARQPAVSLLAQLVTPPREAETQKAPTTNPGALSREDAVVVAAARSLLTLGGKSYRGLVAERAERSPEPLRAQLKRLLST